MAEEKKHVAMVRCEFDEDGIETSTEVHCNGTQLFAFVSKVLTVCAKLTKVSPDDVAKMALISCKLNDSLSDKEERADDAENGEES